MNSIRFRARSLAALAALALAPLAPAAAPNLALEECVRVPDIAAARAKAGGATVGDGVDLGNLTVIELDGDYSRDLDAPRMAVAEKFYATHADRYDFLVTFTTFEFDTGSALAFYTTLRNDVQGIGSPLVDLGQHYGSAARLQGYVDMAATSRYAFAPGDARYRDVLTTLAHEIMHRWGSRVSYRTGGGEISRALVGEHGSHWSYFLDTDASLMYGADWNRRADGRYESVAVRHRFSPLDLYVAGFAAANEVPPMTLIVGGDGNATDLPRLGAISAGTTESISIDQIVAAEGARVPDAAHAPKDFRAALILIKRPGETVPPATIAALEGVRVRLQQYFNQVTDGRASLRLYNEPVAAAPQLPAVLTGSGLAATPPGTAAAVAWIQQQQRADGHWQDRAATAVRDTAAAVLLLQQTDADWPGLSTARAWLAAQTPANRDQQGWQLVASAPTADSPLLAAQSPRGGWALAPGFEDSTLDTAQVADALARRQAGSDAVRRALVQLGSAQNADGSFAHASAGRGRLLPTLRAARVFASADEPAQQAIRDAATQWLASRQRADGSFGDTGTPLNESTLADTIELYGLVGRLPLPATAAGSARDYVIGAQRTAGDWQGSIYLTATAALAQLYDNKANLAATGAATVLPADAISGDQLTLQVRVANTGALSAPASLARWYDGDPAHGGVAFGADQSIPALAAGASTLMQQTWDSAGQVGPRTLWLVLDATDDVAEQSETDNRVAIPVTLAAAPLQADIVLEAARFALTPAAIASLPTTVTLSGTVRNAGRSAVNAARFVLYDDSDPPRVLASSLLDLPAQGAAPLQMSFAAAKAATLPLRLVADPDNVVAEARENNNEARLLLPFGPSLDLDVHDGDLTLLDATPTQGRDVGFRVQVRNRGTLVATNAPLRIALQHGASEDTLFDGRVTIEPGQTVERRVTWRARDAGAATLHVTLDASGEIAELDETNNAAQLPFTVTAGSGSDLTIVTDSLQFTPSPALQGGPLQLTLRVRNLGVEASTACTVALFASDPRSGGTRIAQASLPALAPQAETSLVVNVAELGLASDTPVFVAVDADQQVVESDEGNNIALYTLGVLPFADVAVASAAMTLVPSQPAPGAPQQVQAVVRNLGAQAAQNVVVRLFEGSAETGVAVGNDQVIAELAAGAETTLSWSWTFGLQPGARQLTLVADATAVVRENQESNNLAILPLALQAAGFYASERYFSPNGDGVRDATALYFARSGAGRVDVVIRNAAGRIVRRYDDVLAESASSGQLVWDGRDARDRVVADGDYLAERLGGSVTTARLALTVDTNRSSLVAAIDTPLLTDQPLPAREWFQPPAADTTRDTLLARGRSTDPYNERDGIYRTSTVVPELTAVVSANWVQQYLDQNHVDGGLDPIDARQFSPDGRWIAFYLQHGSQRALAVAATMQTDQIIVLDAEAVSDAQAHRRQQPRFLDANRVIAGTFPQLYIYDLQTRARTPLRALPDDSAELRAYAHGLYVWRSTINDDIAPAYYVPHDAQRAVVTLPSAGPDEQLSIRLNGDGTRAVIRRYSATLESLRLFRADTGIETPLQERVPEPQTFPALAEPGRLPALQAQWIAADDSLLLIDAVARRVQIRSPDGSVRAGVALPPTDTTLDLGPDPAVFDSGHRRADTLYTGEGCVDERTNCAGALWRTTDRREQWFDPATRHAVVLLASEHTGPVACEVGRCFGHAPATLEAFAIDVDDGSYERIAALQNATQIPIDLQPRLRLIDQGAFATDGRHGSAGVWSSRIWRHHEALPHAPRFSGDDANLIVGSNPTLSRAVSALTNLSAQLWAEPIDRAVLLSGFAADLNFAYYQLDWALPSAPTQWHAITPAQREPVLGAEFLSWIPPQPGHYLVRLSVVDKAGNATTRIASALSAFGSPVFELGTDSRYLSPNGDGVKDTATVRFRLSSSAQIPLRIRDVLGHVVREQNAVLAAGPQEFVWDGRSDSGQSLPDGDYVVDVAGQTIRLVLDVTPPAVVGWLQQPNLPVNDGVAPDPDYFNALRANADASDTNFDRLRFELRALDSGDWFEPPLNAAGNLLRQGYGGLAGHAVRVSAYDLAGNRTVHELGSVVEQLLFANCAIDGCEPRHEYRMPTLGPVTYPPDFPSAVDLVVGDPDQVELWLQDGSAGFASISIEIADARRPGEWSTFATLPGTLSPFAFDHVDRGIRLHLPWAELPLGADRRLRAVGIRTDGSRLEGDQLRVRTKGLDAPIVFCPGTDPATVEPTEIRELLSLRPDEVQVVVPVFYDDVAAAVELRVGADRRSIDEGSYRTLTAQAHNARHAYFRFSPEALGLRDVSAVAAVLARAGGIEASSADLLCGTTAPPSATGIILRAAPVRGERCTGVPTQQWRFEASDDFVMHHYDLALNGAGGQYVLLDETPARNDATPGALAAWIRDATLSTTAVAEGRYFATASGITQNGSTRRGEWQIQVDRDAPQAVIDLPSSGSRVCAARDADGFPLLRLGSAVQSESDIDYRLFLSSPSNELGTVCPDDKGLLSDRFCSRLNHTSDVQSLRQIQGTGPAVIALNGRVDAELEVANASGAVVCSVSSFELDSRADLGLGGAPEPAIGEFALILPAEPGEPTAPTHKPLLGLSHAGAPRFRNVTVPLVAREALDYRASVHALIAVVDNGVTHYALGNELATLAQGNAVVGAFPVSWNGRISDVAAADGYYAIRVQATDACGWTATRHYVVDVDSTPPTLAITDPPAGVAPSAAVVAISGIVEDAHFSTFLTAQPFWQLSVEQSGSSLLIAEDDEPLPQPAVLGRWSRGAAQGAGRYVLRAADDFGNTAELAQPFAAPSPLTVLGGAQTTPDLFSPNGDGRLDQTQLRLLLLAPARVDIRVRDAGGNVVATIANDVAFAAGAQSLNWNGSNLTDGVYAIDVVARSVAEPTTSESAVLAATIDTLAPDVVDVTPSAGIANADGDVAFRVVEPRLDRFDAQLVAVDGGAVVARLGGNATTRQTLTALTGLSERDYRLDVIAQDRAGNRREFTQPFTLDTTAPTAVLTAPAAASVLPRGTTPVALFGSASDTHLADYRVELVAAGGASSTTLANGSDPVVNAALGTWAVTQPDGDYTLRLRVRDRADNETVAEHAIAIDGTPPAIELTSPANGAAIAGRLLLQGSVRDAHLRDYQVAIATPTAALAEQWTPLYRGLAVVDAGVIADLDLPLPDGDYVLRVRATDATGARTDARIDLRVDRSAPPAPLQLRVRLDNADAVLDWSAPDAGDLAGYAVYRNGERINVALVAAPHYVDAALADGRWRYEVSAIDRAGNESLRSNRVEIALDRTPPQVELHAPLAASRVHGVMAVIGTAWSADDFDSYQLSARRSDGSSVPVVLAQGSLPQRDTLLAHWNTLAFADDSAVTLRLSARDRSGNDVAREVEVIVDNLAPAAPQGLVATLQGLDGAIAWNPNTETDLLGYLLYRNGRLVNGPAQLPEDLRGYALTATNYLDAALPDGTHRYVVFAIDRAGNISAPSAAADVGPIEHGPPHLTIVAPENDTAFETAIDVRAVSDDRDIATVQFAYRAVGTNDWIALGAAQTDAPYRVRWTPAALPHGEYELRALARDTGGLDDPQPPQVRVRYADLTAPGGPGALQAVADGDTVQLQWGASADASVVAYRVERFDGNDWQRVGDDAIGTTRSDAGLPDGTARYRVRALDAAGNPSAESTDDAEIFSLSVDQPFTPTTAATITLQGRSALPGRVGVRVAGGTEIDHGMTTTGGGFALNDLAITAGDHPIDVRVTSAAGDRSRTATRYVRRAAVPVAPTGVQATASGYDVTVQWNANAEADVIGYRVEHNGGYVHEDDTLAGVIATSTTCCDAGNAVDGSSTTQWDIATWLEPVDLAAATDPQLELDLSGSAIVSALEFDWGDAATASGNLDIEAHTGHDGWVRVAQSRTAASAQQRVALPVAYRTDKLRITVRSPVAAGGSAHLTLNELRVRAWHLVDATTLQQTVLDGQHRYRVAAVSDAALQSAWSTPADIGIGDTTPPEAVVLDGALAANDATLTWTASTSTDVARYRLSRNGTALGDILANAERRYVDANLALGSYAYAIVAIDTFGNTSAASNLVTLTVAGSGPGVPQQLAVTAPPQGGTLQLNWSAGTGSTPVRYLVRRALADNGPFAEVGNVTTTSFTDAPLTNGTRYHYTVEAIDAAGNRSGASASVDGVPRDALAPPAPRLTYPASNGGPIAIDGDRSAVCGRGEAGSRVDLWRDGVVVASTTAAAGVQLSDHATAGTYLYSQLAIAADGWHLADAGNTLRVIDLRDERVETVAVQARLPQWSAQGLTLYYVSGERLYALRPGTTPQALPIATDTLRNYAVSADGSQVLLVGRFAGDTDEALWWMRSDGSAAQRIAGLAAYPFDADARLYLRGDGRQAALATTDGRLLVADLATARIEHAFAADLHIAPSWSPDGRLAFTRSDTGVPTLWRYDTITRTADPWIVLRASTQALAWSPDHTEFAVLGNDRIEGRSALDGAVTFDAPAPVGGSNVGTFRWSPGGRIVVIGSDGFNATRLYAVLPPGAFCTAAVPLRAGANTFAASATDTAGNRSTLSPTLTLTVDGAALPDLAVSSDDLFFVPAAPTPGQSVTALATARNRGTSAVAAVIVDARVQAPDGSARTLPPPAPFALAAGQSRSLSFDLGVLDQTGVYRLRVRLDPAGAIAESDERNNDAEAVVALTHAADPLLDVALADTMLAPGAALAADLRVVNPGAAFRGRLRAQIVAADDSLVADLGDATLSELGTAQTFTRAIVWNSTGVLDGDYRLRARLLRSDGSLAAERSGAFRIDAVRRIDLSVVPTPAVQSLGLPVEIESRLQFSAGNALLTGATLRTSVHSASGAELWSAAQALGTLAPGYHLEKRDTWTTQGFAAGVYTLRARLTAPGQSFTSEASVQLVEPGSAPRVSGAIAVVPGLRVVAGLPGELVYRVDNGGAALTDLALRLRVLRAASLTTVFEREELLSLAAGAGNEQRIALVAPPLALDSYVAVLDAHLPGEPAGQRRELARQGFSVVDELAPLISAQTPLPQALQPALVTLSARVVDTHSEVALAQVRIDGGTWQPLALDAEGRWSLSLGGLGDGAHSYVIRARDTWGNESTATSASFVVDALAPTVAISGIAEGALTNQIVTPTIAIDDAHLDAAATRVNLDGQPYVSATPIASDGEHTLAVVARDTAGNTTYASRHFTIDRTPPTLAIASPADGSTVTQSAVDVDADSEPGARVAVSVGTYQAERIADAVGRAHFASVPLVSGDNRIESIATDAAGNASATRSVTVRFDANPTQPLVGTLQPSLAEQPQGTPLSIAVQLRNPGTAALASQSVRLRLTAADGTPLAQRDYARPFAGGEVFNDTPSFATTDWPLGLVTIRLEIERDAVWQSLDTQSLTMVDRTAPLLQTLGPLADAIVAAPLRVRANASDTLSAPVTVEASVDDGPWSALNAVGSDVFESAALALVDGPHQYRLRAHDTAGNASASAAIAFTVDSTAPQITIAGVVDGELLNHAVTPQITIADAHPGTTTLRLNGQPYVDGTAIAASGSYTLRVDAVDVAGNASTRDIAFTIDRDAPTVTVIEPVPGSTVNDATQDIAGTTEADADVAVEAPGLTTVVRADANGRFRTAAATLQPGSNTLRLRATDRAGNLGDEVAIVVTYVPPAGEALAAHFIDDTITLRRGETLQLDHQLRNSGTLALDAAPVRVQLQSGDGATTYAQHDYTISLSPGAEVTRTSSFATAALTPGGYRAELAASLRDAQGQSHWTVLATVPVLLRNGCAPARPLDLLFRSGFQGTIEDLLFCDGFDATPTKRVDTSPLSWLPRLLFAPARMPTSAPTPRGDAR